MIGPANGFPERAGLPHQEQPAGRDDISFAAVLGNARAAADGVAADRFNEDGFFAFSAAPVPSPRPEPVVVNGPAAVDADKAVPVFGTPARAEPVSVSSRNASGSLTLRGGGMSSDAAGAVGRPVRSASAGVAGTVFAPAPAETIEADMGGNESVRTLRRQAPRLPASTSPVAIAVHEVAGGLAVVAHVAGLDAAERARLAEEIATLLARHGLTARDIAITAPVAAREHQKGNN